MKLKTFEISCILASLAAVVCASCSGGGGGGGGTPAANQGNSGGGGNEGDKPGPTIDYAPESIAGSRIRIGYTNHEVYLGSSSASFSTPGPSGLSYSGPVSYQKTGPNKAMLSIRYSVSGTMVQDSYGYASGELTFESDTTATLVCTYTHVAKMKTSSTGNWITQRNDTTPNLGMRITFL